MLDEGNEGERRETGGEEKEGCSEKPLEWREAGTGGEEYLGMQDTFGGIGERRESLVEGIGIVLVGV